MKPIRELIGRELQWTQPHALKRQFELKAGDELVATLSFRSMFGSFATATTAEGQWTFKRVGFWKPRATVCVAGSEQVIATFRNDTWTAGGTLELASGRSFRANTNFWMTKYEFKSETDEPLVRFQKIGGLLHYSSNVEVQRGAAAMPELPWIVVLGWYLAVVMHEEAAATAAAAG